jgi:Ca2+-binding EF-hand superfamily protein
VARHFLMATATVSALFWAMGTEAQAQRDRPQFAWMDRDQDGVITRDEWRGNDQSFRVHDWNNDGMLSGDEIRGGARRSGRIPDEDDSSDDRANDFRDWTPRAFANLDHNRDGRIARNEWRASRESFRRADRNNDGTLTRTEFLNESGWQNDSESDWQNDNRVDRFDNLDRDNNGIVTRGEWQGNAQRFEALDVNGDGALSRDEVIGRDAPRDLFQSLDADRNGVISRGEWRWSEASFNSRDANRDGVLRRVELDRAGQPPAESVAYRAGAARGLAEGRAAGREDRERNQGWDLEGQRELEQADSGYSPSVGAREEYQAGYREAFRRGYREGYGPRS